MMTTKHRKRLAKKMILPLLAVGLMTLMMYLGRPDRPRGGDHARAGAGTAARVPHALRMR